MVIRSLIAFLKSLVVFHQANTTVSFSYLAVVTVAPSRADIMGCSAGKPLSTSPEISTSTQHSTLAAATGKNEHGLSNNGLVGKFNKIDISSLDILFFLFHVWIRCSKDWLMLGFCWMDG